MDKAGQVVMLANTEVIKEPRGFIKFLEFFLAIFAFATTTSYSDISKFTFACPPSLNGTCIGNMSYGYPFRLNQAQEVTCCGSFWFKMYGDYSSSAQFFVFVGVMAFLYSLGALILYVFADHKYRQEEFIPKADLVITVIFVLFWLIASSAWATGVGDLSYYTWPENYVNGTIPLPEAIKGDFTQQEGGSFSSVKISIAFGFLNMFVWAGNIWFLYKETGWFSGNSQYRGNSQPSPPGSPDDSDSQRRI